MPHLNEARERLDNLNRELRDRQKAAVDSFRNSDWDSTTGDLVPELLMVAYVLTNLELCNLNRQELHHFAFCEGDAFKSVADANVELNLLCEIRTETEQQLAQAETSTNAGNYLQAQQTLANLHRWFADIDYDAYVQNCRSWQQPLDDLTAAFEGLTKVVKQAAPVTNALLAKMKNVLSPKEFHQQKQQKIQAFRNTLEDFKQQVAPYSDCDFKREADAVIQVIESQLGDIEKF